MAVAAPGTVHVVGAGLAGLSAAIRLAEGGRRVVVHEAAGQAGGRCRSFLDETLGVEIDNGNHLLLSGNVAALRYLRTIGADASLRMAVPAAIPFVDLETGETWTLRPSRGRIPWWILARGRRVRGTSARDYLGALRLGSTSPRATVAEALGRPRMLFARFWEPMAVAVLNTRPDRAAARLLRPVITEILARGEAASRPCVAGEGLSRTFIDPALAWLAARGARVNFNQRVRGFRLADAPRGRGDAVAALALADEEIVLAPRDRIVLAVPPPAASQLLPALTVPDRHEPIVNLHYRLDAPVRLPGDSPLLGLIGGTAQWLFARGDVLSVTISAAEQEVEWPAERLIEEVWRDIARALSESGPIPPCRVVKEKRATFSQTPEQNARRPDPRAGPDNLVLAGDWIATGLPATIEGAIRSGEQAAALLLREMAPSLTTEVLPSSPAAH